MPLTMIIAASIFVMAAASLAVLFLLNFYRDPERKIPKGSNIVSPADGKVISIIKTSKRSLKINKGVLGKIEARTGDVARECYVVSIFMSPLDVHINRAPIDGVVESVRHTKGRFFAAYDLEKSLNNENNEITIKNKRIGRIKAIQIAGFLARRIICSARKGEKVKKGQRIGRIALGSQVTMAMDSRKCALRIKEGQRVKAGSSVIAEYR